MINVMLFIEIFSVSANILSFEVLEVFIEPHKLMTKNAKIWKFLEFI